MSISINSNTLYNSYLNSASDISSKTDKLQDTLTNSDLSNADDEELMEVCKSFESYFVEQVFKEMKKTVHSSDDDNEYMQYFGDMLTQTYSESVTDSGQLGLAQLLYESMKRNQ
ncbi:rod-binding protein [Velocimicrobium porci]|uniref:rod-binding protein n=1 Tax=Velocimicrobium porci TaxID=2606634 RepID=UPI0012B302B8|nr:rod-binding protein [Velocimicrobium porci]